jgi:hypothetical protein
MRSLLLLSFLAAPAAADSIPYTIQFDKPLYAVGELATLTVSGPAATKGLVIFDPTSGPITIPGLGTFGVGLSPMLGIYWLPQMPESGVIKLTCGYDCEDSRVGQPTYVQAVSFDFVNQQICLSNTEVLLVEDLNGVCDPHGCTPGYWKNHLEKWAGSGYATSDDFDATFATDLYGPDLSLGQVIATQEGKFKNLPYHAVAALLNAAHQDLTNYPYTVDEVKAMVSEAIHSGDLNQMEQTQIALMSANELGCPF